ncbi:N-formylglutamate amidohydrolase [Martelella alba]|uniref:N-formylglutamate amidohydrolase n=1 Tax=Martelella alba TaxID=2590451 RepID=A0A506U3U5_9HYPH|nr:N-formylglutamate amidohydrolase [Martelella alba]TPW28500.1 N-formylglutamate amidohydrolase [Martelella alba]
MGERLQDWPVPVEIINAGGASEFVLICEHASRFIPAEFEGLGLPETELCRHIAWDIGAADVCRALAVALDAPAFLGTVSRLVLDLNRPKGAQSMMPERSEATGIPGNRDLSATEVDKRIERIFDPFHATIADCLDTRLKAGRKTRIVTIHSFTPVFLGVTRPWHAGVLYGAASGFGEALLAALGADESLVLGANVPYAIDRDSDYAVPVHGDDRGIDAALVELRQDLVAEPAGVALWAKRLEKALVRI